MKIGTVTLQSPFVIAPMAGMTDTAFRRLVKRQGGCGLGQARRELHLVVDFHGRVGGRGIRHREEKRQGGVAREDVIGQLELNNRRRGIS